MALSNTIRYQLGLMGFARVTTILRLARLAFIRATYGDRIYEGLDLPGFDTAQITL